MDEHAAGLIGGIVSGVLGLLGAIVGTYFSVKDVETPAERIRRVQTAAVIWAVVTAGLLWLILGPRPWNQAGMAVCFTPLFVMILMDRRKTRL